MDTDGEGATAVRATVLYSGRVQGVGFRATARRVARRHPAVAGTVRNLANGHVEAVVEGPPAAVRDYLDDLAGVMARFITGAAVTEGPAAGTLRGFEILP